MIFIKPVPLRLCLAFGNGPLHSAAQTLAAALERLEVMCLGAVGLVGSQVP